MDMDGNKLLDRGETFSVVAAVMKSSGKEIDMDSFDKYMAQIDKNQDSMISREEMEIACIEIAKTNGVLEVEAAAVSEKAPEPEVKPVV